MKEFEVIKKIFDRNDAGFRREFQSLVNFLKNVVSEGEYRALAQKVLGVFPDFEKKKTSLHMGLFSGSDFLQLMQSFSGGHGIRLTVASEMLEKLKKWELVFDNDLAFSNGKIRYQWNKEKIKKFLEWDIIDNVILGSSYFVKKYEYSVPPVLVEKEGNKFTGTGFLCSLFDGTDNYYIITAKHNVDLNEGLDFKSFGPAGDELYKVLSSEWITHPKLDLATMPVECTGNPVPICLFGEAFVLSPTVSLGYPRIATADDSYVLASGGEINAIIRTYYDEQRLIISNSVQPGNSGGPVLDEAGLCLGVVVNAFEAHHEGGISKSNSAIPSSEVYKFIKNIVN